MEIYSPGGMVDGSSLDGSGFKKILEDYDFQENVRKELMPKFQAEHKGFTLTLYNLNYLEGQNDAKNVAQDVAQNVAQEKTASKYEKQILELIKNNGKITREEIAQKIGVSKKTIEREMKKLINVTYVGSGYSGHWEIKG